MPGKLLGTRESRHDYEIFLKLLLLVGLVGFGCVVAGELGLLRLIVRSDRSGISLAIGALYLVFCGHGFMLALDVSRERAAARRGRAIIAAAAADSEFGVSQSGDITADGTRLPAGILSQHIGNLIVKAQKQDAPRLDQTLLVQNLGDRMNGRQNIGWFVSDTLIKLGLLGTIIGFIFMLSSVSSIDNFDVEHLKRALAAMSGGMAIALFTTLTGLIAGTVLKLQYHMIDAATAELFEAIVEATEVHVVSALDRVNGAK